MFILFVFLTIALVMKFPNVHADDSTNFVNHAIMFVLLTIYFIGSRMIEAVLQKQPIILSQILRDSLKISIPGLLGFVIFTDLKMFGPSKDIIANITTNRISMAYTIGLFIIVFITLLKMFQIMTQTETFTIGNKLN